MNSETETNSRPSYDYVDELERQAQLNSRSEDLLPKSFVTDLWMKVIMRAIDDLIYIGILERLGKELQGEDLVIKETAEGFIFDDGYEIFFEDYLIECKCQKCEYTWQKPMSEAAGFDVTCQRCDYKSSWKTAVYRIPDQKVKSICLQELLSLWGIENFEEVREGIKTRVENMIEKKIRSKRRNKDMELPKEDESWIQMSLF
jgi:hypothetical protein